MAFIRRTAPALLVAALAAAPAPGQPMGYPTAPPPAYVPQPPAQTMVNAGAALPPAAVSAPPPAAYAPALYNPYGYPGYQGPVGGALSGAADVISASGQYYIDTAQAKMMNTQADMQHLDYRTKLLQQQAYEKSLIPSSLELKQQQDWQRLQSARNNPSDPEIWSGAALNALYTALQGADAQGLRADPVPIGPDVLKHINLSTGQDAGAGAGMLKDLGSLDWPFALQAPPFLDGATKVNTLASRAVDEVKSAGKVSAATFQQLDAAVTNLDDAVAANQTLSPTDYITCKGFVDDLQSSIQSLRNPNVAMYFNGGYAAKGPTVNDLVRQMTSQGLRFAPATAADQPSYTALYQALRTYDYRLAQLASR